MICTGGQERKKGGRVRARKESRLPSNTELKGEANVSSEVAGAKQIMRVRGTRGERDGSRKSKGAEKSNGIQK